MLGFASTLFGQPRRLNNVYNNRTVISSLSGTPNTSSRGMGIVITGSTKGVGRALAETFLTFNDNVVVTSRNEAHVQDALTSIRKTIPNARVFGFVADVAKHEDVENLISFASETMGTVNAIICNAGTVGDKRAPLHAQHPDDLKMVIETNLLGSIFCAREAIRIANDQTRPVHVFLMDGSGTRGGATPGYAAYGASKRCVPQLVASLNAESKKENVRFHKLSPGMVLTDLLLKGNKDLSPRVRQIFNIMAEEPETVAQTLVPRIRSVIESDQRNKYIAFLTVPKAMYRLGTGFLLGFRKNLFFDEVSGRRIDTSATYNENGVRIKD